MKATLVNGVDVEELGRKVKALQADPELAACRFHVSNQWIDCGHNRTRIESWYGLKQENPHDHPFELDCDEPAALLGTAQGANPVEHLLNALAGCLTSAMVYHAAVRGIQIESVRSEIEGEIDLRGFVGLSDDVRKGYRNIRVTFHVVSDAPVEKLKECASFSPVFDTVGHGTSINLKIQKA